MKPQVLQLLNTQFLIQLHKRTKFRNMEIFLVLQIQQKIVLKKIPNSDVYQKHICVLLYFENNNSLLMMGRNLLYLPV